MLHILFVILKVIGILLLVILGIILFLIFAVLLLPFSYQVQGEKTEETWNARIRLSWLFYAVYLVKEFGGTNAHFECYLFGIPIFRLRTWLNHKRTGKKTKTGTKSKKIVESDSVKSVESEVDPEIVRTETFQNSEGSERKKDSEETNNTEKISDTKAAEHKKSFFRFPKKICFTIRKIYGRIKNIILFLRSEDLRWMKKVGLAEGKALFRHIRPKKMKGNIRFGFENPANTGEVLGILGIIYPILPRKFTIIPDFNQSILEGSLKASGRVYGIFFLIHILKVLFDGKTVTIIKNSKHKEA